ncbi:endonuclease domain-containing protein [Marinoscillum sp. 108]|uniref:endonuclease domain-containing protein n=1 Tax=Marinoscillum sp. 108 TaxID=2653151 RepID=UPI0012F021DF|nr:endonuclease domain-containing protein [Marinoscillum sp. 108]VXD18749.1 DNA methylase [Marinoscillum sp. 108]
MRRKIIPYHPKLKELARQLRNNSTKSEIRLWQCLKGKQMMGYDFHRQKPLLEYIADFYCYELELVIELDGYTHNFEEVVEKDEIKQKALEEVGLTVMRFADVEVMHDINNVLRAIENYILDREKHTPDPSQEGRNGDQHQSTGK